ncbi:MAG: hypothetical protein HYW07_14125 [Candidatus Latescibacteria bacterium]|nr:hypothetical protein [Candidatus Latescibacterota bacterium]
MVLVLDELERGIQFISDPATQAQNIAFLQMLSEWSNREDQVTLLASIYSDQQEPGSTLKRVSHCRIRFEHAADKARVVLHRLFENFLDLKPESVRPTVDSYLAAWRRHDGVRGEEWAAKLSESFPFSPDLLEVVLERVPARGGFQNVRGALGFLARLVKLTHQKTDLITPAHADLGDQEVAIRLGDLDPSGDLVRRTRENLKELNASPLVPGLGATAMLYTLSGTGKDRGATREHLLRAVTTPATNINDFEQALLVLQRYGSYFHFQEGHYFFDQEENAEAKVEFRSLMVNEPRAKGYLLKIWRDELFREQQAAVVFTDVEETQEGLKAMDKGRLRFVLSPRRLKPEERHLLYYGPEERNQIILLEPKDAGFDILSHRDLIKWAQRNLAASELLGNSQDAARKAEYERLAREDHKNILETLRRAGLIYLRVERYGSKAEEDEFVEESLGNSTSKEDVVSRLSQDFYPTPLIAEDLATRLADYKGVTIKDVDRDYRTLLGRPVPTHVSSVFKAVRQLCKEGKLGVRHQSGDFSGKEPDLTESELANATLDAPFERLRPTPPPMTTPLPQEPTPEPPSPNPGSGGALPSPEPPGDQVEEISVPAQAGPGGLRQALAQRLQGKEGAKVRRARFTIFLEHATGDLSNLPASLRGSLSGSGALTAEIRITKEEVGGKGEVEQLAERLPNVAGAMYSARLEVLVPAPAPVEG